MNLRQKTLEVASGMIGVRERGGNNRGPEVEMFQRAAGIGRGDAWCAAFCNWCAERGARALNVISPMESVPLQGYVPSYASKFPRVEPAEVLPGDLFVIWFPNRGRFAHIGFVKSIDVGAGRYQTIEGNSNDEGSREGYEVCSNTRRIGSRVRFLRWTRVVKPRPA